MGVREFTSLTDFIVHVAKAQAALAQAEHSALEKAAKLVTREAKAEIGHYQEAQGPFPAWAPLAESTEARKAAKGYPAGAPLLASGEMRDNIGYEISGNDAVVGSPDERAVFHEFGTSKMPPRPVFGPAAFKNLEKLHQIMGATVVAGILDGKVMPGGADYFLGN